MRRLKYILSIVAMTTLVVASHAQGSVSYYTDDMYGTHNKELIERKEEQALIQQKAKEERWMVQWAALLGMEVDEMARESEIYDTPYGERLRALAADEYQLPESYYQYQYQDVIQELSQYDPELYDATIDSSGNITIAPKYVSSTYGVWGMPYYDNFSWYYGFPYYRASYGFGYGFTFGWGYPYYGWGYPYYGWGYPYFSWRRPPHYAPPHRPSVSRGSTRSIVSRTSASVSPSSKGTSSSKSTVTQKRNPNGSTVGSSSKPSNSYNRTTTTTTPSRSPSTSAPQPSAPSRRTNSIGR